MKKEYIVFLVLVLILGFLAYVIGTPKSNFEENNSQNQDQTVLPSPTPTLATTPAASPTKSSGKLNYGEAIKKYQFRIQFVDCHGNPGSISLKRNLPLMLDNRDAKTHTIKVAGQSYTVKAYDYALAYISKEGSYNLTCDGGGAGNVNIEN